MRGWIVLLTLTSAALSVYEAFLFAVMSQVVDWLAATPVADFWQQQRGSMLGIAAILLGSIRAAGPAHHGHAPGAGHQFPMRMRWVFHRLMLGRSIWFYADEFAAASPPKSCKPHWPCAR